MGVSTKIVAMKCVMVMLVGWVGAAAACPSLCSCRGGTGAAAVAAAGGPGAESAPAAGESAAPGEPLRLRCGGPPALISELKEIDFTDVSASVVSLNMSSNAISTLSRDLHLPNLQKLDLSHNQISLIETDAFYNITGLQRLDLSHNQIGAVTREMFKGLAALERLLLDHNLLATLPPDAFHHLVALKQLDITENPWECDCALVWVGAWARSTAVRLAGGPRCAAPPALAGRSLRKLRVLLDLAACDTLPTPVLATSPARDQLVFEGDALALTCSAPLASALHAYELRWTHADAEQETCELNATSTDVLEEGAAETTVWLREVAPQHAGEWTCEYWDAARGRHRRTVRLTVLGDGTRYCPTAVSADNRGLLSWPQLPLNRTAEVPCRAGAGLARRRCGPDGAWAAPDTAQCAYVSNVTKLLQQFALLELSLVPTSALNASARLAALLRASTYPLALVADPDDVMFVARAVANYMQYLPGQPELGSALLDVVSAAMLVPPAVMAAAEAAHGACSALVRAAFDLAHGDHDKQKSNLAVESFAVRAGFGGATCAWYSAGEAPAPPRLHCTTTNRTVARLLTFSDALIHASVQVPASLQLALAGDGDGARLAVAVFADAALFPLLARAPPAAEPRAKDYYGRSTKRDDMDMEITSPVVALQLRNGSLASPLLEPVIATLRAGGCAGGARCAVWRAADARWHHNDTECRVLHVAGCTWVVSLARPGVVALVARAERGVYGARVAGARFKVSHPAVYVGSLLLLACLGGAAGTYAAAGAGLLMPRRRRHALANTWLAQAALCLLYTLGIYQTEDARLCRALGLLLHYLSLCCLAWMCVAAHGLLARARRRGPGPGPGPARKPVLGLYLCGWGGALIVCGISGAVNLREYAGYAQCFPGSAGALAALLAPGALLLLGLAALCLLTRCALRAAAARHSEGTQATEQVELEPWEPPPPPPERRSLRSAAASEPGPEPEPEDAQQAPLVQLRAQAIVLGLHLAAWASGAVAVYRPLPAYLPYQEDICSIVYAVCATVLGTFTLFFYGIARSDVRAQWALMHCYLQGGKPCCRNRSVFDSNRRGLPPAPAPLAVAVADDARSRSGSRSSNKTNSKTNNSAIYKAGAELNGQTLRRDSKNTNGKAANINLVVLHRQQYRSNNSMMTCPDTASAGPEAFYNPNQMNVAKKFFKRQRQNVKRNRLELPSRRDFDDESHASLPLPARALRGVADLLGAGSKVNNTNIHVEPAGQPRAGDDPNLLREPPEHKPCRADVVNIYTNVGETRAPRHERLPTTRTVAQQCSLEGSSASEPPPRSASERTLDTSEPTERDPDPGAAAETTDTDSFGRYVDCRRDDRAPAPRDVPEEAGGPLPRDAGSTTASEHGEDESDIYCPNYQMSEVSIRSHGLYAPSPSSMCPNEIGLSAEDVSHGESQYVNLDPGWRGPAGAAGVGAGAGVAGARRAGSPLSEASDLDELYTRITSGGGGGGGGGGEGDALDATAHSDVTLRPDSDADDAAPGGTLRGTTV